MYQFLTDNKVMLLVIIAGIYQVGRCVGIYAVERLSVYSRY